MTAALLPAIIAVSLLGAIAFAIVRVLGLERPWLQPWALVRAIVQLGLLTLVLQVVIDRVEWVVVFLAVMVVAAAIMVARRLGWRWRTVAPTAGLIAACALLPSLLIFGIGAIELRPNLLLAVGGIVVGNVMSVSTLFCRSLRDRFLTDRDQIEGRLALGATPRRAARDSVRAAGSIAIMPSTDQTRVTGLVTLPGAFVGAVFAGLPVIDAAVFQLVVLASILAAGAAAIALWTWALGAPRTLPAG